MTAGEFCARNNFRRREIDPGVIAALEQAGWNVAGAARLLGTERTSLHKRIRTLGIRRS